MNAGERAKALSTELRELFKWQQAEEVKITSRLKAEGRYKIGLDANNEAYAEIMSESRRRYREIITKYKGLPPDTKLKLW